MYDQYSHFIENLNVFLLVLTRVTGLFVIAPIFGRRNIPVYFKVGFSFFVALIVINAVPPNTVLNSDNLWAYSLMISKEMIVGITIGYVGFVIFTGIYIAGQLIDMQIGFGVVNVLDPMSNIQVPVSANFYHTITMLLFLMMDGHHILIRALYQSYSLVPINGAVFNQVLMGDVLRVFGTLFVVAFKIAAPVIAAVLVTDISLGIIAKTVPQLNIFVVGMPLKIALGLCVMVIAMPSFTVLAKALIRGMDTEMFQFLKDMGPIK